MKARRYESVSHQMWLCALKHKHTILTAVTGAKQVLSMEEVKFFINSYEDWLEANNLKTVPGTNDLLNLSVDDRLTRFMWEQGIATIDFIEEIGGKKHEK